MPATSLKSSPDPADAPDRLPALVPAAPILPPRRAALRLWLTRNPLIAPAIGMVAGIVVSAALPLPVIVDVLAFAACGAGLVTLRRRPLVGQILLAAAAASVGAALHDTSFRRLPGNHVARYVGDTAISTRVTGKVLADPRLRVSDAGLTGWLRGDPRTSLLIEAAGLQGIDSPLPVRGLVAVTVREPLLDVAAGDVVELFGTLYRPRPPDSPGVRDFALMRRRDAIHVEMSCPHAAGVRVLRSADDASGFLARLRTRARAAMLEDTWPHDVPGASMLPALVLGQRSAVDRDINDAFVRTGTVHYLSVSGAHVGMLAAAVWLVGLLFGIARRPLAVAAMIVITAYALLAEPQPPILRAAVMSDLFCIALLLRRPVRTANWLAASLLVLLPFQPSQVFSPGFQLSYLTLAGILYLHPRLHAAATRAYRRLRRRDDPLLSPEIQRMLNPPTPWQARRDRLLHSASIALSVAVAAWCVSLPLSMYHFQQVAWWGWAGSLLVMPLVWVVLVLGLLKTVVAAILPQVALVLGWPLAIASDLLLAVVERLGRLPGAGVSSPMPPGWLTVAILILFAVCASAGALRIRARSLGLIVLAVLIVTAWRLAPAARAERLRLLVLPVGSGLTSVLQLPDGHTLLYDVGAFPPYDLERWSLGPALASESLYGVDAVILSHPNLDHYSGLGELLDRRRVGAVISTPFFEPLSAPGDAAHRLIDHAREHGVPWLTARRGDALAATGDVRIEVLWPPPPEHLPLTDGNDTSLVLRVTWAGRRILLCGDIERPAQRELIAEEDLRADILLLPHHGGVVDNTGQFIRAVDPRICIRSSGESNAETLNGLLDLVAGRDYHNTADEGAVEVSIGANGAMEVRTWRRR